MASQDLIVIKKAKELMHHTLIKSGNCKKFPKKYRHSLVDKMNIKAMDIYDALIEANGINKNLYPTQRIAIQTKAITYCEQLNWYVEESNRLNFINSKEMQYWVSLVLDVKHLTIVWRSKEERK